ncbi:MAG TPA: hypothetical protein PK018_04565 [Candidatus Competibacter sp.]|nr:hypothetical protein [Candidatus Competibacteraceae bacterium]HPE71440.1 hypothetical protein [Candidatus Competibacter sp.]HRW67862.1 hypothetical protein [Candidatus Competibacter sp.]
MRFEDLPPETRAALEQAVRQFLRENHSVSLDEAGQERGLPLPDLWRWILAEAGLPDSDPPDFSPFA